MRERSLGPAIAFAIVLGLSACGGTAGGDVDAGGGTCEPACRSGFVCLRDECVSACNPVCDADERCTDDGECVPDGPDAGVVDASSEDAGSLPDASAEDASADAADGSIGADAGPPDAGPATTCPAGQYLCAGACTAPVLPDVGARTPTSGRYSDDWLDEGDIAVDPCTGNVGLAFPRQVSGGENWEIWVTVVPAAGGASPTTPVRVTTAPGQADSVAVAWAGDRFGVFWSDPRHDPAPESCSSCLQELYYAAFDTTTGAIVVPEVRLTTHASSYRAGGTRAVWGPDAGAIGVAWTDSRGSRQVHGAIVSPEGVMRAEQAVSAAPSTHRGNTPRIVWNDGAWQLLYRHDDPDGARPDYLHTRRLEPSGTLGADVDLRVPAEQIGLTARDGIGYATVTGGGSPLSLRLWDLGWTATTTLASTTGTFDGTRELAWDGANLYVTSTGLRLEVVRYNGLGTETGRILLTNDSLQRSASGLRMHRLGTRLVVSWMWSTGGISPIAHHQVHVVDTSSAM